MKRGLVAWLIATFLLSALVTLVAFNLYKTRILVLHSADRGNGWVQKVDEGIRSALAGNRRPVSVHWHYLGMERFVNEDERQDAATLALRAIDQFRPDVVLAVDDEAQAYVARQLAVRPGGPPANGPATRVVFAGIDLAPSAHGYAGATNVTGIVEHLPLAAIRDAVLALRGGRPARLAVIGPTDETGHGQMQQVQAFDWGPHRVVQAQSLPDFAAWRSAIDGLGDSADVLLVLSFGGLPESAAATRNTRMQEVAGWIEGHAKALPIGVGTSFVENGGGLAIAPSPHEIGEVAMQQALAWTDGRAAAAGPPPPVAENVHYRVAADGAALRRRGVALPSIYLEAARLERTVPAP